jgi:hypothetical protein
LLFAAPAENRHRPRQPRSRYRSLAPRASAPPLR